MKIKRELARLLSAVCAVLLLGGLFAPIGFAEAVDSGNPALLRDSGETGVTLYTSFDAYYAAALRETTFDELIKPEGLTLLRSDNGENFYLPVNWSAEDYAHGISSGAESFPIACIPDSARLAPEDKQLWDAGLLALEAPIELNVQVMDSAKPTFTITMIPRGGDNENCYPKFEYPMPHGASSITVESSLDGVNWYSYSEPGDGVNQFFWFADSVHRSSLRYTGPADEDPPVRFSMSKPSWHRMRVVGSLYDGESDIFYYNLMTLPPVMPSPDDENDDISGNRGGGGQTEESRSILNKRDDGSQSGGKLKNADKIAVEPSTPGAEESGTSEPLSGGQAPAGVASPANGQPPSSGETNANGQPTSSSEAISNGQTTSSGAPDASVNADSSATVLPEDDVPSMAVTASPPPERVQQNAFSPAAAVAVVAVGVAGLAGVLFMKKKL